MKHALKTKWRASFAVLLTAVSWLLTPAFSQTPATTTIRDTVYRSDGSVASGTVVIKWPAFVTGDGRSVFGGTKAVPITDGALAVALVPNAGGSPSGTSYNVRYFQSGGVFFEETWVVPGSSPLDSPTAPNVATVGTTGSTTYYYWVTATNASGETLLSPSGLIATANSTLDTNNYNQITWSAVSGATGYKVYRSNNASAPGGTGNHLVGETAALSLDDQSNTLNAATVPALNTTDPRTLSAVRVLAAPSPSVTLAAAQVQGNAIVSNPSTTQTIAAPSGSGVPLQIKGRSNNSSNIFEVYDNQTTPVLRSWFGTSGALQTSQAPIISTFTPGSLLFSGAGGVLSQDNANLFWDNAAKRLQLGGNMEITAPDAADQYGLFVSTSGTSGTIQGTQNEVYSSGGSAIANLYGNNAYLEHDSTGTLNNAVGMNVDSVVKGGGAGNITAVTGLYIQDQTAGISNFAIRTGIGKVQFGDTLYAKAISEVRYADQFTGGTAGSKIAAAIAALPATGGTVDARGLEGAQILSEVIIAKPVTLLLGCGTYTTSAGQALKVQSDDVRIVGSGRCTVVKQGDGLNNILVLAQKSIAATSTTLNGAIDATQTTITVVSTSGFQAEDTLFVDSEQIRIVSVDSGTGLTVERAIGDTLAAAHADTTPVGGDLRQLKGVEFSSFAIDLNKANNTSTADATNTGLQINDTLFRVEGMYIRDGVRGVSTSELSSGVIGQNFISGQRKNGVLVATGSRGVRVVNNVLWDNGDTAVSNNSNHIGVQSEARNTYIAGNYITGGLVGVLAETTGTNLKEPGRLVITNNQIADGRSGGIQLRNSGSNKTFSVEISGNSIRRVGQVSPAGDTVGVLVQNAGGVRVIGNFVDTIRNQAIRVNNTSAVALANVEVSWNRIRNHNTLGSGATAAIDIDTTGASGDMTNFRVRDNEIYSGAAGRGIQINNTIGGATVSGVEFTDNLIRDLATPWNFVATGTNSDFSFRGNRPEPAGFLAGTLHSKEALSWASKVLVNNTNTALVNATIANNTSIGGMVSYCVEVVDAANDQQVECGKVTYTAMHKGGTVSGNTATKFGNVQPTPTAGTLAVTWTITAANPAVLTLNANSSLTPSAGYPRVTFSLENLTQQAVAVQ